MNMTGSRLEAVAEDDEAPRHGEECGGDDDGGDVHGRLLSSRARALDGSKRAGVLSALQISTVARELGTARTKFDQRSYGDAFKDLCEAYQPLR